MGGSSGNAAIRIQAESPSSRATSLEQIRPVRSGLPTATTAFLVEASNVTIGGDRGRRGKRHRLQRRLGRDRGRKPGHHDPGQLHLRQSRRRLQQWARHRPFDRGTRRDAERRRRRRRRPQRRAELPRDHVGDLRRGEHDGRRHDQQHRGDDLRSRLLRRPGLFAQTAGSPRREDVSRVRAGHDRRVRQRCFQRGASRGGSQRLPRHRHRWLPTGAPPSSRRDSSSRWRPGRARPAATDARSRASRSSTGRP